MALYIGTSGFAYASWKGGFYPATVPQSKFLPWYASMFGAVEINYTFNRFPTEHLLGGWAAKVPDGFRFCLKAPRRITHELRLRDCLEPIERFFEPQTDRCGPALFQLPPTARADLALLDEFCALLSRPAAFEFRHESWDTDETRAILAKAGAAWVVADTDERDAAVHITTPAYTYVRMRKTQYTPEQLWAWRDVLGSMIDDGVDVYCFLRHDDGGDGVLAASLLRESFRKQRLEAGQDLAGRREEDAGESDLLGGADVGGDVVDE